MPDEFQGTLIVRKGSGALTASAEAITHIIGTALLLADQGETFMLSSMPIWFRPVAVGLSASQQG